MSHSASSIQITRQPPTVDTIQLRDIQLHLPTAPEAWHRIGAPQPCTASLRLSYSSSIPAAEADDVTRTIDYGKVFRRITQSFQRVGETNTEHGYRLEDYIITADGIPLQKILTDKTGQDIRLFAAIMARSCIEILNECAVSILDVACPHPTAISIDYGEFDLRLHLPKAILRAAGGLWHRSIFAIGNVQEQDPTARRLVLMDQEFEVREIRCFCILGINPWERLEKQAVNISLKFKGPRVQKWGSTVVETYQSMSRGVAESVEKTSFGSVEALASFIARIVTVDYGNYEVTVLVEKPNALAFVGGSGLEITRSRAFYE